MDALPEPFNFICEILEQDVMLSVNLKIFEIEAMKSNPSYEGGLKSIWPSGVIELDTISAMSNTSCVKSDYMVSGDASGHLYLIDQSRRNVITKFDSGTNKAAISISFQTIR